MVATDDRADRVAGRGRAWLAWIVALAALCVLIAAASRRPAELDRIAASRTVQFRIDPNTADEPTLCLLPGIGPTIARRVVADREANGPYQSAEDLARVPRIGQKTVEAVRPWIRCEPSGP